jgi:hypothetical protein
MGCAIKRANLTSTQPQFFRNVSLWPNYSRRRFLAEVLVSSTEQLRKEPVQGRTVVRPCRALFQLMAMVTGLEWLSEPDVPVTVTVT